MLTCTLIATDQGLMLARSEIEAVADAPCLKVAPLLGELTNEKVKEVLTSVPKLFEK